MRQKPGTKRSHDEKVVKDIRRATRKQYSAGSAFTARAVFDDSFADTNPDCATGSFFDFGTATSALVPFELTTELGTVSMSRPQCKALPGPSLRHVSGKFRQQTGKPCRSHRMAVVIL